MPSTRRKATDKPARPTFTPAQRGILEPLIVACAKASIGHFKARAKAAVAKDKAAAKAGVVAADVECERAGMELFFALAEVAAERDGK